MRWPGRRVWPTVPLPPPFARSSQPCWWLLLSRGRHAWLSIFEAAGIPCGPVNDLADVFADPQVQARGMVAGLPHPLADALPLVNSPIRLSATPVAHRHAPPLLGQHTEEVLRELDAFATSKGVSRAEAIRASIAVGLPLLNLGIDQAFSF